MRTIPFVVLSALVDADDEPVLDAAVVLRKPVEAAELLAALVRFDSPIRR